jgi:preprotein translocase subunit SecF
VIAALLTLVGYSMNDTIVTFDRIRENLKLQVRGSFAEIVNLSINQTLSRTVLTSGLTFLTALSLLLFGGQVLSGFSLALVIGIIIGTYSSIFVASPILLVGRNFTEGRTRPVSKNVKAVKAVK